MQVAYQRQERRQAATTHLVLTTNLLGLNVAELETRVTLELAENPALELETELRCPRCGRPLENGATCPDCLKREAADGHTMIIEVPRPLHSHSIPDEPDEDWTASLARSVPLRDYLWEQLAPSLETEAEHVIGAYLIERLDEHGYLEESPKDVALYLHCPIEAVESVLERLWQVEPVGVGARDARQCLEIQLRHLAESGEGHPLALDLVRLAWDRLIAGDMKGAAARLGVQVGDVIEATEFIADNLYPYPAAVYHDGYRHPTGPVERFAEPDVIIKLRDDGNGVKRLVVEMVTFSPYQLRIDDLYRQEADLARARAESEGESPPQWAEMVGRASFFIKCLYQRNQTLRVMMKQLVGVQRDFILKGDRYLKPMTRAELAKMVGVHESTISRAVAGKTVALPDGRIVPLAMFFDRSLSVRDRIRDIIEHEERPLTDGEIAVMLKAEGIKVARRTVAKYRNALGIPPASLRRRILTIHPGGER